MYCLFHLLLLLPYTIEWPFKIWAVCPFKLIEVSWDTYCLNNSIFIRWNCISYIYALLIFGIEALIYAVYGLHTNKSTYLQRRSWKAFNISHLIRIYFEFEVRHSLYLVFFLVVNIVCSFLRFRKFCIQYKEESFLFFR